jgi:hypothetical protein
MECPGAHVGVKIGEIGIVSYRFVARPPTQAGTDALCQGCFASADIPGYHDEMFGHL